MKSEARIEKITPQKAAQWLAKNTANRPCSKTHVERLAKALKCGEYQLNGDAIRFADDGDLLDGQHRLSAVILSGVTIDSYVIRGLPKEIFKTLGGAKPRGVSDTFAIAGERHYTALATTLRLLVELASGRNDMSASLAAEILSRHPGIRDSVEFVCSEGRDFKLARGIPCSIHYLTSAAGHTDKASEFWRGVFSGESLTKGQPTYQFRKLVLDDLGTARRLKVKHMAVAAIKAWNLFATGNTQKLLGVRLDEQFPKIVDSISLDTIIGTNGRA